MREEDSNWFARWEEELPTPEELMPLSQSLITPDLALAFDIPTSPSSSTPTVDHPSRLRHHHLSQYPSTPPHLLSSLHHLHQDSLQSLEQSAHQLPPLQPDFDSSDLGSGGGGGGAGVPGEEPARTLKRPRLVWTPQLHKRFVDAVAHLGIKNAVPKTIMQLMNVEGLTRENVASHLQKYRLYLKRMQGLSSGGAGGPVSAADSATDHLFASAPVPHHFLSRGPASGAGIHGGGAGSPEQFLPFAQVAALQHHQQMAAAAAHQQQHQYYHQRHMGHIGSPPGGGFERGYLTRQQQPGIQMTVAPGGTATGPSPPAASYLEDAESGAGTGGRKMLTLFPTGIFEIFRGILHEGEIDKRVQFLIEGLFAIRKAKFQGFPAVRPELDLVEVEDQFTHEMSLEDEIDPETDQDVCKPNPQFLENEKAYENLQRSILGDDSSEDEDGSEPAIDDEHGDEEEDDKYMKIMDETETNLVNLRRTIYFTIMASVDFEEAGHKLLKIKLEPGQEMELCIMLLECCSQERIYLRYYGLLGQRFCMINKVYQENFEKCFVQQYSMIHQLETNKLWNVAVFFAHLLGTDALPWHVLGYICLTEEDTTASSRIFIKILFQELSEHLGISLMNERLTDPTMQDSFESICPWNNPKNTRFSINFFTSIGLGGITENLRKYLKNMPRLIMQQQKPVSESNDEFGSSGSSSLGSSSTESESESESESERHRKQRRRG